jgi:1,4-alpha-glucan branching enzyme
MSIIKKYLKKKPVCKVTFKVPKEAAKTVNSVHVVGDFNNWDELATPMKRLKNGDYTATVDLELYKEYEFRYLKDENEWENDWEADKYTHSPFGNCDNSVVVV